MLALDPTECKAIAVAGAGVVEAHANIQSNSSGAECVGRTDRFQPDGRQHHQRRSRRMRRAASSASSRTRVSGLDDLHGGPELVRLARSVCATSPHPRSRPSRRRCGSWARARLRARHRSPARVERIGSNRTRPPRASACSGRPIAYSNLAWILYPGLYPGGLKVNAGTTAYLMPGIYWLGGGGIDVDTGGSIVSIGAVTDAKAVVSTAPCATATTTAALCGGVMFYNSKLPSLGGRPGRPQLERRDDEARVARRPVDGPEPRSTRTSSSSRTGPSRRP